MAGFKVYDPEKVSIIICGIPISGGYADGSFIEIEQDSNDFNDVVGTDGEVTRSKSNDRRATIRVRLMQSASANNALSALNALDKKAGNGAGVGPSMIRDKQGTTLFAASKSWIAKPPAVTFDRTATERVWEIRCADLERLDGGN